MTIYILRRLLVFIPTFIGATLLAFIVIQAAPGDFTTRFLLDPSLEKSYVQDLQRQFGFDQPLVVQYLKWLTSIMTGYLGVSLSYQTDVWTVIAPRIANSLILVVGGILVLYLISIPVGIFTALRKGSWLDNVISFISFISLAIPNFFFALLYLFFAVWLNDVSGSKLLPIGGMTSQTLGGVAFADAPRLQQWMNILWHAMPAIFISGTDGIAGSVRYMRGQILEELPSDYIRTAKAKGLAQSVVLYKHALRNAIIPLIAGIGGLLPGLIGGAGLVELVLGWPGVTPLLLESVAAQDLYVVMGFTTLTTVLLIMGNLLSDILLAAVDPRIRYN